MSALPLQKQGSEDTRLDRARRFGRFRWASSLARHTSRLGSQTAPLARAYASVLFCDSPWVGAWFATLTWFSPRTALPGLLGLLCAAGWGRVLGLSRPGEPHLVNGLLAGLVIGAAHAFDTQAVAWIALAALFATLSAHWLAALLWQAGKLPVLSLPFTLVAWAVLLTQPDRAASLAAIARLANTQTWATPWLDAFFTALGWLFLIPDPRAGALLFAGLAVASRYLALLAAAGYLAGLAGFHGFSAGDPHGNGFNFMLAAMALGGIFTVPGRAGFLFALAGSALAGWIVAALNGLLYVHALPLLTAPFLLAVYLGLGALSTRQVRRKPFLNLEHAAAPEIAYERARLAEARGAAIDSLGLALPFYGEWQVSQGFDGPHTHRDAWRHALDFHIVENGRGYRGDGGAVSDYFCFGAPVLAPVAGQVARLRADLPDLPPGEVDLVNNWGNFVLLRMGNGLYVKLAHLKQDSLTVGVGAWVEAGQQIAACGSSGRSPEPHLHLHVQTGEHLGSPTLPFHFSPLLVGGGGVAGRRFHLCRRPQEGDIVSAAPRNEPLADALKLPAGRRLSYRLQTVAHGEAQTASLRVELTLLGQFRLATQRASAAFEKTPAVIGFYDRQGQADPLLGLWLLALGLTPFSSAAGHWADRPPLGWLPLGWHQRCLAALLRPLGAGCDSQYRRHWDEAAQLWRQQGEHRVRLAPGIEWRADTQADIEPGTGVRRLRLDGFGQTWEAVLDGTGWISDQAQGSTGA